jgi:hypothetical protein
VIEQIAGAIDKAVDAKFEDDPEPFHTLNRETGDKVTCATYIATQRWQSDGC